VKILFVFLLLTAVPASVTDISGVWKIDGSVASTPVTPTCTLKQAEAKLSGSCKFDTEEVSDVSDVTGEAKEKDVTWHFSLKYQGSDYSLTFHGTLDSDTSMKGSISVDPSVAEGDFTAKKQ
jgi:hypothetical protein